MVDWVLENKEWIFSGAGIAIITIIGGLLIKRKNDYLTAQSQNMGDGGIQAGGDVNITQYHNNVSLKKSKKPQVALIAEDFSESNTDHAINKSYNKFVGRRRELEQITTMLSSSHGALYVAIYGIGGVGKTSLACEAIDYCNDNDLFDYYVWVTAKREMFHDEAIIPNYENSGVFTSEEVINAICRQCNLPHVIQLPMSQRKAHIKQLLNNSSALIVLDNLEEIESHELSLLLAELETIIGNSKVLLTSRHRIKHDKIRAINLDGFSEVEGLRYIQDESERLGLSIEDKHLSDIFKVTSGLPLALKLVVGQLSYLPIKLAINNLKEVSFKGKDYELYRFIYQHSWYLLDKHSRMILVDLSRFSPMSGGKSYHIAKMVDHLSEQNLWKSMKKLIDLSLVYKVGESGNERYFLHSLTQYFIKSDITKEWVA